MLVKGGLRIMLVRVLKKLEVLLDDEIERRAKSKEPATIGLASPDPEDKPQRPKLKLSLLKGVQQDLPHTNVVHLPTRPRVIEVDNNPFEDDDNAVPVVHMARVIDPLVALVVTEREEDVRRLTIYQERLVQMIDEHHDEVKDSIDSMGCRGDCTNCPHPEFPTVQEQVQSCITSMVDALDLDRALLTV